MALPTLEDVAKAAGVSRSLVSLVMRGSDKVGDARRERVLAAAAQLGYRPNVMARNLASRRTHTIGVLLDDLHNPFYAEIADGLLAAADDAGYRALLTSGRRTPTVQHDMIDMMVEHRTDGIIVVSPRTGSAALERAAALTPLVVVAEPLHSDLFDTVTNDETFGVRVLVEHLLALGHRDIVHVDGGRGSGAAARRDAFVEAVSGALSVAPQVVPSEFTEAGGRAAAEWLLRRPELPTAVFAANDISAAGLIDRFEEAGLDIPADISVVGYDNTSMAGLMRMSLTTVEQPMAAMGREAIRLLIERIDGIRTTVHRSVIEPRLVVRNTSGPAPARTGAATTAGAAG